MCHWFYHFPGETRSFLLKIPSKSKKNNTGPEKSLEKIREEGKEKISGILFVIPLTEIKLKNDLEEKVIEKFLNLIRVRNP